MPSKRSGAERRALLGISNHLQAQQSMHKSFADAVGASPQLMHKSPSHKSVSTDEGSSSSGYSSSPVSSESSTKLQFSNPVSSKPAEHVCMLSDVVGNAPLWVDNGLKGDKAAWLLVLSKFSAGGSAAGGLRSPKDAVLLGPYVTTKNTFLDESRVSDAVRDHQRVRSKSWGQCR